MTMRRFTCPVCGFPDLLESPYLAHDCPSYEICPCCGVEFGYDDAKTTFVTLRGKWIEDGKRWWSSNPAPKDWDANAQLSKAGFLN